MQNADDVDGVTGYAIDHNIGQRRKHKLPRALLLAGTSATGKRGVSSKR
jgi:hypothetical protein